LFRFERQAAAKAELVSVKASEGASLLPGKQEVTTGATPTPFPQFIIDGSQYVGATDMKNCFRSSVTYCNFRAAVRSGPITIRGLFDNNLTTRGKT
jgi:hypothetical protein